MVQFPTANGGDAGRWCPDGKGDGHHVAANCTKLTKLEDAKLKLQEARRKFWWYGICADAELDAARAHYNKISEDPDRHSPVDASTLGSKIGASTTTAKKQNQKQNQCKPAKEAPKSKPVKENKTSKNDASGTGTAAASASAAPATASLQSTHHLSPTELTYFEDTYLFEDKSVVLDVLTEESGEKALILKSTIFYPQGGGQPSDVGEIKGPQGEIFEVKNVKMAAGIVYHCGAMTSGSNADVACFKGADVALKVDASTRILHARLHSAGHLLDVCMSAAGYGPDVLQPTKGYHFPEPEPYVEYKGKIEKTEFDRVSAAIEAEAKRLISQGMGVNADQLGYNDAANACGGSLPPYIAADSNPRIVVIGDAPGCPCGGTHVKDVAEVKALKVTNIRVRKGVTRVSYSIGL